MRASGVQNFDTIHPDYFKIKHLKKLVTFSFLCVLFTCSVFAQRTKNPKQDDYLFFLHNRFTEEMPLQAAHPEYGKSQYSEIIAAFNSAGFKVLSEKRPIGTDITVDAKKIIIQIDSLLQLGVPANHITVVGISKGGYIAQMTSTLLANPDVNFVFIGSYRNQDLTKMPDIDFCGNILNIYEKSDEFGVSAIARKESSKLKVKRFKEIELNTGLKHGFLFRPLKEWIVPVTMWANRKYDLLLSEQ